MADDTMIATKDHIDPGKESGTHPQMAPNNAELPLSQTNIVSYVTYAWLDRFMWKAFRKGLTANDIWQCSYEEGSEHNVKFLEEAWQEEQKNKGEKASLTRVFLRYVRKHLIIATIILILSLGVLVLTVAYFLLSILRVSLSTTDEWWYGLLFVLALLIADLLQNVLFLTVFTLTHTAGTRLRSGALALVYQKLLSLRVLSEQSSGNLVNIFASDSTRLFDGISYAPMLFTAPVLAIAVTAYSCYLLGPWPLLGFLILLFLFPVQMILGKIIMTLREKAITTTDKRVQLMTEILSNIKFIKMYAWETSFHSSVSDIRNEERKIIEKVNLASTVAFSVSMIIVAIATVSTIMALTLTGHDLSPAKAFTYLAVFTSIQGKLMLSTLAVKFASEFKVAAERIQRFLQTKQQVKRQKISPNRQSVPPDSNYIIDVRSASLSWPSLIQPKPQNDTSPNGDIKNAEGHQEKSEDSEIKPMLNSDNTNRHSSSEYALQKISFKIEKGDVIGIAGGVGSGKSALINAILGQLSVEEGDVIVRGETAYVPQIPWIINATLRENIVFGHAWDQNRYDRVIKSCCLNDDLDNLLAGDETEIGERGINLSGGQKQRVSFARAVYSDRDIYLLDDPFSAVDPDIAEKLYQQVVQNELVGKTILLATHQVKFLNHCDSIMMLQQGRIVERGSHEDLVDKENGVYAEFVSNVDGREQDFNMRQRALSEADTEIAQLQSNDAIITPTTSKSTLRQLSQTPALKLIKDEEQEVGAVTMTTYKTYVWCAGGAVALLMAFLLFLATEGVRAFSYWWLAFWISQGSGVQDNINSTLQFDNSTTPNMPSIPNMSENPRLGYYNLVYGMSVIILLVTLLLRSFVYSKIVMRASNHLHQALLNTILHLPMRFFDVTPLGRIINRFSRDMDELDSKLPPVMDQTIQCMLAVITYLIMIGVVINWFLIVVPPLAAIFIFLYAIFRRGSRDLQRLQNISISPLLSHISTTVQGLSSIHAYDKVQEFHKRFVALQDHNSVLVLLCNLSQRWVNLRLSLVTTIAISLTALFIVLLPNHVMPAYAGLAIVYASQLSTLFQFFVRMAVETETKFISAERINTYTQNMDDETHQAINLRSSPGIWPSKGHIKFIDFSARYRDGLPLVLSDVTLEILPGEKVGLVGRTGSGKSSLAAAIFRLFDATNGRIEIDDTDISNLSVIEVRSNLSVIPQDSVMFKGTIRSNLDPARRNIDHELWHALERCQIKDMVNALEEKLNAPVAENGENFSYGERQLICMARALLRHSKIVVLDEATAGVDTEMDTLIQQSLRSAFVDCTMIIIAHRFSTVMGLDKVIVMDHGKVIEMDTPSALVAKKDSKFSKLMALGVDTVSSSSAENILNDAWV